QQRFVHRLSPLFPYREHASSSAIATSNAKLITNDSGLCHHQRLGRRAKTNDTPTCSATAEFARKSTAVAPARDHSRVSPGQSTTRKISRPNVRSLIIHFVSSRYSLPATRCSEVSQSALAQSVSAIRPHAM